MNGRASEDGSEFDEFVTLPRSLDKLYRRSRRCLDKWYHKPAASVPVGWNGWRCWWRMRADEERMIDLIICPVGAKY